MFEDYDADGVRDANEPAQSGVSVYLDLNRNGVRDAAGTAEPVAVTDSDGNYTFDRVRPGDYVVREVVPPGYRQTLPGPGVAEPGPGVFFGAAYDAQGQLQLAEVDARTGKVTRIGAPMATRMHGLVMTNDGTLYGMNGFDAGDGFYRVDRTTGQATLVGRPGLDLVWGMTYDPATDTIYGLGTTAPGVISLLVFDRATGAATPRGTGTTGLTGTSGLAFDAAGGRVLALDNDDRQLYSFSAATGAATLLSVLPAGSVGWGLAFDGRYAVLGLNGANNTTFGYYDPDTGLRAKTLNLSEPASVESLEFVAAEPFTRRVTVGTAEAVTGVDFGNKGPNRAPVASAGGPYAATEGQSLALDASGSSDVEGGALSYTWDLNGDGQFGDATGVAPALTWAQLAALGIADDGSYTVGVRVTDADPDGALSSTATATLTVLNAAPTIGSLTGPVAGVQTAATPNGPAVTFTGVRGQALAFAAAFSDVGTLDTHEVRWDFGDGTVTGWLASAGTSAAPPHTYAAAGTYTVTAAVRDDDGGTTSFARQVEIKAVELQADPNDPAKASLVVGGTTGDDSIEIEPGVSVGSAEVFVNGASLGTYSPTGSLTVFAQAGNDDVVAAGSVALPARFYGGAGDDRLKGGAGHDVLLGGAGDDLLVGGAGRDLLFGGLGADRIVGNADDDVLIAGVYLFEGDAGHLGAVMAEWTRGDRTGAERVENLKNGTGLNGSVVLNGDTLQNDLDADVLSGSSGYDWFLFDSTRDRVTGLSDGAFTNDLPFING